MHCGIFLSYNQLKAQAMNAHIQEQSIYYAQNTEHFYNTISTFSMKWRQTTTKLNRLDQKYQDLLESDKNHKQIFKKQLLLTIAYCPVGMGALACMPFLPPFTNFAYFSVLCASLLFSAIAVNPEKTRKKVSLVKKFFSPNELKNVDCEYDIIMKKEMTALDMELFSYISELLPTNKNPIDVFYILSLLNESAHNNYIDAAKYKLDSFNDFNANAAVHTIDSIHLLPESVVRVLSNSKASVHFLDATNDPHIIDSIAAYFKNHDFLERHNFENPKILKAIQNCRPDWDNSTILLIDKMLKGDSVVTTIIDSTREESCVMKEEPIKNNLRLEDFFKDIYDYCVTQKTWQEFEAMSTRIQKNINLLRSDFSEQISLEKKSTFENIVHTDIPQLIQNWAVLQALEGTAQEKNELLECLMVIDNELVSILNSIKESSVKSNAVIKKMYMAK